MTKNLDKLADLDTPALRELIRSGTFTGQTSGFAAGKLQANLAILPERYAEDFETYCRLNPKPCPLVGRTRTGDPHWTELGDIDLRTDLPSYNVYQNGLLTEAVTDIRDLWQDDLVGFALGCSFTFERALMQAGIDMHHINANKTVPMYRTSLETTAVGPFGGGMVVSMRMLKADEVETANRVTAAYPWAHGAPVHVGDPAEIGIDDINAPDWGDPPLGEGVPVFWGCGVTPQNALATAHLPLCITHTPGRMLITDIDDTADAFLPEKQTEPTGDR